jgi:ABC-2 type transport system ATP-binding protein
VAGFTEGAARTWVTVRSPQIEEIAKALRAEGAELTIGLGGSLDVVGPTSTEIGELAARLGATLHELSPQRASLEDVFLEVTAGAQQYRGAGPGAPAPPPPPPPPGSPSDGPAAGGAR